MVDMSVARKVIATYPQQISLVTKCYRWGEGGGRGLTLTSDGDWGAEVEPPALILEAVDEEDEVGESEEKLEKSDGHDEARRCRCDG